MWRIIILLVMVIFLIWLFELKGKLGKRGTQLKKRIICELGLYIAVMFISICIVWSERKALIYAILLGMPASIPFCINKMEKLESKIRGNKIVHKPKPKNDDEDEKKTAKGFVKEIIAAAVLGIIYGIKEVIIEKIWGEGMVDKIMLWATCLILAVVTALFISEVYALLHVIKLERKLGKPILEYQEKREEIQMH